jgi:hypothetical protein
MIQWYNTKRLDANRNSRFYPSWYDPSSRTGEAASMEGEVSTWEIVHRKDMVALFSWDEEATSAVDGGRKLPETMRSLM